MHTENLSDWVHDHVFHTSNEAAERSTRVVMWITAITMVMEIFAGWWFNSMALFGGWMFGWSWLDPLMGIVGAILVTVWAKGLIADTGKILLDREMDHPVVDEIREVIETGPDSGETRITDLHVWRVGKQVYSCAMTVVTHDRYLTTESLRAQLSVHEEIVHSTIELHYCDDATDEARLAA